VKSYCSMNSCGLRALCVVLRGTLRVGAGLLGLLCGWVIRSEIAFGEQNPGELTQTTARERTQRLRAIAQRNASVKWRFRYD
jgi:hypothetical protein